MSLITDILGGNLLSGLKGIIGEFVVDPTKRAELAAQAQQLAVQQAALVEQTMQKEIDAKQAIMTAELTQGDNYTKRARPTIIYAGLLGMLVNYVLLPWLAYFTHGAATPPPIAIPDTFWGIWGGVCGIYVIGRTTEKTGTSLPWTTPIPRPIKNVTPPTPAAK